MAEAGASFADFGRHPGEEVVFLVRSSRGFEAGWRADAKATYGHIGEPINYDDTAESRQFREEVRAINRQLAKADLNYVGNGCPPMDVHDRSLRRHFTLGAGGSADAPRFDCNGRLFGGWWQNLNKAERCHIRIDGEGVADLDYAGMFPRLAYLRAGLKPPEGDLYAIPGVVFPSWTSWLGVLEDLNELLGFSSTKHDDQVNSLSQALGWTDQEHQRPKMRIRRL